jgi:hypothetical protein
MEIGVEGGGGEGKGRREEWVLVESIADMILTVESRVT